MYEISRVTCTHEQARASYDRLSRWYDFIEGGWESKPRRLGLDLLQLKPGIKMLEVSCGPGNSLQELPAEVSAVGLDLSFRMLMQASGRLNLARKAVRLVEGDALCLPFPTGHFDVTFMSFALDLVDTPEISIVLGEIHRVLRPGGQLGIVSSSKLGGRAIMKRLYEWAHARFPVLVDCRPIYARRAIEDAGFLVSDYQLLTQTGLGIEVVVGRKN